MENCKGTNAFLKHLILHTHKNGYVYVFVCFANNNQFFKGLCMFNE